MLGKTLSSLLILMLLASPLVVAGQTNQQQIQIIVRLIDLIYQLIDRLEATPPPAPSRVEGPVISSVSPDRGPVGTTIVIRGRGFTVQDNTVYTGYGPLNLSSPDGATLTFVFSPPGVPPNLGQVKTADFPELIFGIYVVNQNGQTLEPGKFTFVP